MVIIPAPSSRISCLFSTLRRVISQVKCCFAPEVDERLMAQLGPRLQNEWERQVKLDDTKKGPNLAKACLTLFGRPYLAIAIYLVLGDLVFRTMQAKQLSKLVKMLHPGSQAEWQDVVTCSVLGVLANLMTNALSHKFMYHAYTLGLQFRSACTSLLHAKALGSRQALLSHQVTSEVVLGDLSRLARLLAHLHFLWLGPTQVVLRLAGLWPHTGWGTLLALAAVFVYGPVQGVVGRLVARTQTQLTEATARRSDALRYLLLSIRAVKMSALGPVYMRLLSTLRRQEVVLLRTLGLLRSVNRGLSLTHSKAVLAACLWGVIDGGHVLRADTMVLMLICLGNVRLTLTQQFTLACADAVELVKCLARLQALLMKSEYRCSPCLRVCGAPLSQFCRLMRPGQLVVITGPRFSGKSQLLEELMVELVEGTNLRISVSPQHGWTFPGTTMENLSFEKVGGGDREAMMRRLGINGCDDAMYGAEEAVSLARALLKPADVYIFDEISDRLDDENASFLFDNLKLQLKDKIRIVVTRKSKILAEADLILLMDQGSVLATGSLKKLSSIFERKITAMFQQEELELNELKRTTRSDEIITPIKHDEKKREDQNDVNDWLRICCKSTQHRSCFYGLYFLLIVILLFSSYALVSLSDYWLVIWTFNDEHKETTVMAAETTNNHTAAWIMYDPVDNWKYIFDVFINNALILYTVMITCILILLTSSFWLIFKLCVDSSQRLHDELTFSVLIRPLSYFSKENIGNLSNLLCGELQVLDDLLASLLSDTAEACLGVVGAVFFLASLGTWFVPGALFFLAVVAATVARSHGEIMQSRRLEASTETSLCEHLMCVLQSPGAARAFKLEHRLNAGMAEAQRCHAAAWATLHSAHLRQATWLDFTSATHLALAIVVMLTSSHSDDLPAKASLVLFTHLMFVPAFERLSRLTPELINLSSTPKRMKII